MDTPSWYAEIERDEAELDARIREQSRAARTPRVRCLVCGLEHRAVCPSGPDVAAILSAPTPEPVDYTLPACER